MVSSLWQFAIFVPVNTALAAAVFINAMIWFVAALQLKPCEHILCSVYGRKVIAA